MMGRLSHDQEQFFYSFRLDEAVLKLYSQFIKPVVLRLASADCTPRSAT